MIHYNICYNIEATHFSQYVTVNRIYKQHSVWSAVE